MNIVVARIERIRGGHSDRSLIHAIDASGRELRIEVASDAVRGLAAGPGHLLVLSWAIHENPTPPALAAPGADAPASAPQPQPGEAPPSGVPPSAVDAQFMALMTRSSAPDRPPDRPAAGELAEPQPPQPSTPDEQLARLLGMSRDRKPAT